MCTEDLSFCPFCGYTRRMHWVRCNLWLQAYKQTMAGVTSCLDEARMPDPDRRPNRASNMKIPIRPGACPQGPPVFAPSDRSGNNSASANQPPVLDADGQYHQPEIQSGCVGYQVRHEMRAASSSVWEKEWGHRSVRFHMGLSRVPPAMGNKPQVPDDHRQQQTRARQPVRRKDAGKSDPAVSTGHTPPPRPPTPPRQKRNFPTQQRENQGQDQGQEQGQGLGKGQGRGQTQAQDRTPGQGRGQGEGEGEGQAQGQAQGNARQRRIRWVDDLPTREQGPPRPGQTRRHSHHGGKTQQHAAPTPGLHRVRRQSDMTAAIRPPGQMRQRHFNGPLERPQR